MCVLAAAARLCLPIRSSPVRPLRAGQPAPMKEDNGLLGGSLVPTARERCRRTPEQHAAPRRAAARGDLYLSLQTRSRWRWRITWTSRSSATRPCWPIPRWSCAGGGFARGVSTNVTRPNSASINSGHHGRHHAERHRGIERRFFQRGGGSVVQAPVPRSPTRSILSSSSNGASDHSTEQRFRHRHQRADSALNTGNFAITKGFSPHHGKPGPQ